MLPIFFSQTFKCSSDQTLLVLSSIENWKNLLIASYNLSENYFPPNLHTIHSPLFISFHFGILNRLIYAVIIYVLPSADWSGGFLVRKSCKSSAWRSEIKNFAIKTLERKFYMLNFACTLFSSFWHILNTSVAIAQLHSDAALLFCVESGSFAKHCTGISRFKKKEMWSSKCKRGTKNNEILRSLKRLCFDSRKVDLESHENQRRIIILGSFLS